NSSVDESALRPGLRRGILLVEPEDPAGGIDGDGVFVLVHSPAGHVDLMRPCIAGVAIAGVPVPMPVVVTALFIIGPVWRGPQPLIVVKAGGGLAIGRHAVG